MGTVKKLAFVKTKENFKNLNGILVKLGEPQKTNEGKKRYQFDFMDEEKGEIVTFDMVEESFIFINETPKEVDYFGDKGNYSKELSELTEKMMEVSGSSKTLNGEMIRAINRLVHEFYNNGNGNAIDIEYEMVEEICWTCVGSGEYPGENDTDEDNDSCDECGGSGTLENEEKTEVKISEFYLKFLNIISNNIKGSESYIDELLDTIEETYNFSDSSKFSNERNLKYNVVADIVTVFVSNFPELDKPLSEVENYEIEN